MQERTASATPSPTAGGSPRRAEKVFCLWNIASGCNYRCPYCFFDTTWDEINARTGHLTAEQWTAFWDRFHLRYGTAHIGVAGAGEPFLYRGFSELIRRVAEKHEVGITTNLSWDVTREAPLFRGRPVRFHASYHPYALPVETFLEKTSYLRAHGFDVTASLVAYPPLLPRVESILAAMAAAGVKCFLKPFAGRYEGREYPAAHSPDEKALLRRLGHDRAVPFQIWDIRTEGKLCRAGQKGFALRYDGTALRCSNTGEKIGHALDPDFRLMKEPLPCPVPRCTCAALAPCLVENDDSRLTDDRYTVLLHS
jgi:MoaA/NifB/PqqE/SkfB family radical SAM enzyme